MFLVILYDVAPVKYLIDTAWSTHMLNLATHESIYCLFPKATLDNKLMYIPRLPEASALRFYKMYTDRGYRRQVDKSLQQTVEFSNERYVGDELTSRFRFDASAAGVPAHLQMVKFAVTPFGICLVKK